MAGLIYSSGEMSRTQDLLNKQEEQMKGIDKEKEAQNSSVLRYTIIIAGAVVLLVLLKVGLSIKRK
jgi:hypothetical protein